MRGQLNGTCECGCGMITNILHHDDPESGRRKGQHMRFVHGHYHRLMRQIDPNYGKQNERFVLREKRRSDLVKEVLCSKGEISLDVIVKEVAPEFNLNSASRMINSAREWGYYGDIPRLLVRRPVIKPRRSTYKPTEQQKLPRYERPDIPYERETEIKMLLWQRHVSALDAPLFDGETMTMHDKFCCGVLNPLEILMLKEQEESEEELERQKRIQEWQRWEAKRTSVFKNLVA